MPTAGILKNIRWAEMLTCLIFQEIISNPHFFGIILSFLFPWCPWLRSGFITHKLPDFILNKDYSFFIYGLDVK
jgi:hypothetical protein